MGRHEVDSGRGAVPDRDFAYRDFAYNRPEN